MGMIISMVTVKNETIQKLLENPVLVWKVIAPDDPSLFEEMVKESQPKESIFKKILGIMNESSKNNGKQLDLILSTDEGEGMDCDLDKSWHAIHFMLTGTAWEGNYPENFIILGGTEIGDIDFGYGPARAITSEQLLGIQSFLNQLSADNLMMRYNSATLTAESVYPEIWDRADEENQTKDYIKKNYENLKFFIQKAIAQQLGIVIWCG